MGRAMKSYRKWVGAILGAAAVSCGGGSPSTPVIVATPTPSPVVVATPTPAPTPEPTPEPEAPVQRVTPPVRITLRLFVVEDGRGGVYQYRETQEGLPLIPVGYYFRLDIIAKDSKNKETRGSGEVRWHWDGHLIDEDNLRNIYHPRLRAARDGKFCARAELDQIMSNEICTEFRYQ
jgi:hypothetical protein